jgi:hypothetical protein
MKWGHIIVEVLVLYFKLAGVYLAYHFAQVSIAQNRPSLNPPFAKRIRGYLWCIAVVTVIALLASANSEGDDEESQIVSMNYNRGATVFIALLIPVLFGATEGYRTREKFPTNSHSDYGDQ